MTKKTILHLTLGLAGLVLFFLLSARLIQPVSAAPAAQFTYEPTPTPRPDGKIVYIVQPGDSAWSIAARFGFVNEKYNELKMLNRWGDNPIINEGDEIVLGYAGPSEAEATQNAGPTPTPTVGAPTPTSPPGFGRLCIIFYNDLNGDSLRQEEEGSVPGGAISVSNRTGSVSRTVDTGATLDLVCYDEYPDGPYMVSFAEELPEGRYTVSVAVPDDYNPTTTLTLDVTLNAGDITILDFGAQAGSLAAPIAAIENDPQAPSGNSPVLGILGVSLLLVGVGMGIFAGRLMKLRAKLARKLSE
ncbi:LysM domain-containing protein [bacterium]|nr:MAG: LysM domain-containing protein [bacterium]